MHIQRQKWGLCSHSPLLPGPLRLPGDPCIPVATPLSSSCHCGNFIFSQNIYYLSWSRAHSIGTSWLPELHTLIQKIPVVCAHFFLFFLLLDRTVFIPNTPHPHLFSQLNRNVLSCLTQPELSNIPHIFLFTFFFFFLTVVDSFIHRQCQISVCAAVTVLYNTLFASVFWARQTEINTD